MFFVGTVPASEFDVLVVDAGGQLPVSDALFFVAGDWLPTACPSLFPLVQLRRASLRPPRPRPQHAQVVSPVSLLAKEIKTRVRKFASVWKIESRTCSLSYATKVRTRINDDNDYKKKNFSEEASKGSSLERTPIQTFFPPVTLIPSPPPPPLH